MKYVTYDFEGELVCGKDGSPVVHDSYNEADAVKGMGVVAEHELTIATFEEPLPEVYSRTESHFLRLRTIAEEQIPATIKEGTPQYMACVALNIVKESEREKGSIKAIQLGVLIEVAKNDLHLAHPPTDSYPNGFNSIRDFMKAAGMNPQGGHFYEMAQFASEVVPYLDAKNVEYGLNVDSTQVAKTLEAVPTMRAMVRGKENKSEFVDILDKLFKMSGKRAATAEYRSRRDGDRLGDACVNHIDDETAVITVVTSNAGEIVSTLKGKVTWDKLVATVKTQGRAIEVSTSKL